MILCLDLFSLRLPLESPVLIFSLILFIILFAPILLNKLKIPSLIGLIMAGALIGQYGLNLMARNSSIILFGTVGLLYIMFLAGLEIDLVEFKKNSKKSIVFGLYTFAIPMALGLVAGLYVLHFSMLTSVLLASMFASHTLIAYPIVSRLGAIKNRAVNITVGGTMITDTLALLVLAAVVGVTSGNATAAFWLRLGLSVIVFTAIILFLFPILARWFFKKYQDNVSQYIFVLALVFMGAFLAEASGIEAIIGAFLVGLALNRLIPHTSPLMNRIEFVGNALFIPFFLIGVGMLIDFRAFFKDIETIKVAIVMTVVALLAKFLAAWAAQKTYGFSKSERSLIFGLSSAQAAATLAAVLVGYNIIIGQDANGLPIRLLGDSVLNGTILMILVTCTIASLAAQRGAEQLVDSEGGADESKNQMESSERILIATNELGAVEDLVQLSLTIKSKKNTRGLYALNVLEESDVEANDEKKARKVLDKAVTTAAAADTILTDLLRFDTNIVNAVSSVVREHQITDLVLGLHRGKEISDSFLGDLTKGILLKNKTTTFIYKSLQPISTIKRHIVVVPANAEKEVGFTQWVSRIWDMAKNTGAKMIFYSSAEVIATLREIQEKKPIDAEYHEFMDWNDFLIISKYVKSNDNIIVVLSRKNNESYHSSMSKIPSYLNTYFAENNFILVYPIQIHIAEEVGLGLGETLPEDGEDESQILSLEKMRGFLLSMLKKS